MLLEMWSEMGEWSEGARPDDAPRRGRASWWYETRAHTRFAIASLDSGHVKADGEEWGSLAQP